MCRDSESQIKNKYTCYTFTQNKATFIGHNSLKLI